MHNVKIHSKSNNIVKQQQRALNGAGCNAAPTGNTVAPIWRQCGAHEAPMWRARGAKVTPRLHQVRVKSIPRTYPKGAHPAPEPHQCRNMVALWARQGGTR